jgi:hypothetical protein
MTLPPNLRAGRIVYYTSIPTDVSNLSDPDQRFWREYIDFVLGDTSNESSYTPKNELASYEPKPWPEGKSISLASTSNYSFSIRSGGRTYSYSNPEPYMVYTDNPNRPRAHFWFGPITMMDFIASRGPLRYWWPGTCHEAQCWQLKAAMNSALNDIRANHPNDCCGLSFFAYGSDGNSMYKTPRAPMGQDWTTLKNSLFYPNSLLTAIKNGDTTTELAPYNSSFDSALIGDVPNADGGTDPNSGLAQAFNMLSSSTTAYNLSPGSGKNGGTGRRGAAKIVIYETDGVPNATPSWSITGSGTNTYYKNSGSNESWSNPNGLDTSGLNSAALVALQVVQRIVAPVSTSGTSGFSLPNVPARVYAIGFGDLFTGYDGTNGWSGPANAGSAVKFLLRTSQAGNTLPLSASTTFPTSSVITGPYRTRINNLRDTLQRIMQSGVQVTLIE